MSTFTLLCELLRHYVVWLCRLRRYFKQNFTAYIFWNLIKKALLFYFLSSQDLLTYTSELKDSCQRQKYFRYFSNMER